MPSLKERLRGGVQPVKSTEMKAEILRLFEGFKQEMKVEIQRILAEKTDLTTLKGDRGYTPKKGVDFLTPPEMKQLKKELKGSNGSDGKDGVSPEIDDLVEAVLESLPAQKEKEEKKITIADVEGLKGILEAIGRNKKGGGGGGGMGKLETELNNVSSATTTVSTTYKIAGGVWVFLTYNGQTLHRGTDYTVGSDRKTITLLFTPSDSTVIQLDYIRS